jgi:hypothetical protein
MPMLILVTAAVGTFTIQVTIGVCHALLDAIVQKMQKHKNHQTNNG